MSEEDLHKIPSNSTHTMSSKTANIIQSPRSNMQLLSLPQPIKARPSEASISSYRSDDGLSNMSIGSLNPLEDDAEFLSEYNLQLFLVTKT